MHLPNGFVVKASTIKIGIVVDIFQRYDFSLSLKLAKLNKMMDRVELNKKTQTTSNNKQV